MLQVAEDLAAAGLSLKEARSVADLMKAMKKAGIDPRVPDQLEAALHRHAALGYEAKQRGWRRSGRGSRASGSVLTTLKLVSPGSAASRSWAWTRARRRR